MQPQPADKERKWEGLQPRLRCYNMKMTNSNLLVIFVLQQRSKEISEFWKLRFGLDVIPHNFLHQLQHVNELQLASMQGQQLVNKLWLFSINFN